MTVAVVARGTGPAWACRLSGVIPLLAAIFLLHGVQGVCLLLLTAGVVLLAVALRRLGRSDPDRDPGAPSGAGPPVGRAGPPSLAQLCLLRI
jgi:hypothetical protein